MRLRRKQPVRPPAGALSVPGGPDPVSLEDHGVMRILHINGRKKLYVPLARDGSTLQDVFSGARTTFVQYIRRDGVPVPDADPPPIHDYFWKDDGSLCEDAERELPYEWTGTTILYPPEAPPTEDELKRLAAFRAKYILWR